MGERLKQAVFSKAKEQGSRDTPLFLATGQLPPAMNGAPPSLSQRRFLLPGHTYFVDNEQSGLNWRAHKERCDCRGLPSARYLPGIRIVANKGCFKYHFGIACTVVASAVRACPTRGPCRLWWATRCPIDWP